MFLSTEDDLFVNKLFTGLSRRRYYIFISRGRGSRLQDNGSPEHRSSTRMHGTDDGKDVVSSQLRLRNPSQGRQDVTRSHGQVRARRNFQHYLFQIDRGNIFSAGVGTMFALPWYLTWFGHSLNQYRDVVRLYDFFLASPQLMPLYVAAALVVYRRREVLNEPCEMASIHCLLSQIPDNLDFEEILISAARYYQKHPPDKMEKDVKKRIQNEYVKYNTIFFKLFRCIKYLLSFAYIGRFFRVRTRKKYV